MMRGKLGLSISISFYDSLRAAVRSGGLTFSYQLNYWPVDNFTRFFVPHAGYVGNSVLTNWPEGQFANRGLTLFALLEKLIDSVRAKKGADREESFVSLVYVSDTRQPRRETSPACVCSSSSAIGYTTNHPTRVNGGACFERSSLDTRSVDTLSRMYSAASPSLTHCPLALGACGVVDRLPRCQLDREAKSQISQSMNFLE